MKLKKNYLNDILMVTVFAASFVFLFLSFGNVYAADGSGTNSVTPTSTDIGTTGNTFNFTFTAAETMDSGGITITSPSGWSAANGTPGTAGYTTISTTGMIADVEDTMDSATGWSAGSACASGAPTADTGVKHEGTASIRCTNGNESNNDQWYKNIAAQNWSAYTRVGFWIRTNVALTSGQLEFAYDNSSNLASALEAISIPAISANTWTYVTLNFGVTARTSIASYGFRANGNSAIDNKTIYIDDILLGPGLPTFPGGGVVNARILQLANTQTITAAYGSGGGASGVTAQSVAGVYTATTTARISDSGTLTNIALQPTLTAKNKVPTTTSISPTSATAGSSQFTLTVNGTNFVSTSVVNFNGVAKTTTFVSATQLTAIILASDIATAGTASITVTNPTPGGGTSNAQTLTISSGAPTTTSISPTSATAGDSGFTMTINGTNFTASSAVQFNGSDRATTFISSTQLTASILTGDLTTAGTFSITVVTPAPGGGTSNAQTFTVNNPVPTITSISPTSASAGDSGFVITVNGTNFVANSVVKWNDSSRTTTFVSSTQITASIPASDIISAGTSAITVFNPTPGGGTSNSQTFTINNPAPTTTSISPSTVTAGGSSFTLTVNGSNFVTTSVVKINGVNRTTNFVSSIQLTATILDSDISTAGTASITVTNPTPGGGTSNAQTLTINNPVPTTTSISPTSVIEGSAGFSMTVNGTNFVASSVVNFNGSARTTTYVSATELSVAVLTSDIATSGTSSITVTNPTPGGGTSNAQTFTITALNPAPTTTSISPTSVIEGSSGFIMTVNGTNFISSSVVRFNGSDRVTTFVNSTELSVAVLTSDIATPGTYSITVFTSTPGGGTSNAQSFTVTALNPVPTTTSIASSSVMVGDSGFTMTVNGTNFISSSVVKFNGSNRSTTFVNSTQVTAAILTSDLTSAGTSTITVFNPTPGGGTSNAQILTINNPVPTTSSISPSSKTAGDANFTLTVTGTNFVSNSVVKFSGSNRTTTYVSPTQLTAVILASDIATAGSYLITVFNSAPTGGISNAQTLGVSAPPDITAPATIGNLFTSNPTNNSIDISWLAPGDDGSVGTASSYDVRYSTSLITSANFSSATVANNIPVPQIAGSLQSMTVSGLTDNTTYYFAIRTSDEVPNTSAISNVVSASTTAIPDTTAPSAVIDLATSNLTNSSIDISWTAPGDNNNSGTATSYDIRYSTSLITSANFSSATAATGIPVPQISGSLQSMTVSGLTANTTYYFAIRTSDEVPNTSAISNVVSAATPPISSPVPTVAVTATPIFAGGGAPSAALLTGQAYPGSSIEVARKRLTAPAYEGSSITNVTVKDNGQFEASIGYFPKDDYLFTILAKDKNGTKTRLLAFTQTVEGGTQTKFNGILMPPTIGSDVSAVTKGNQFSIFGYAAPNSRMEVFVDDVKIAETQSGIDGKYRISLLTNSLADGVHKVKTRYWMDSNSASDFSLPVTIQITSLINPKTDINGDGKITVSDLSIFISRWSGGNKAARDSIDFNGDGKIDVKDVSIFISLFGR